jgi:RecJ-like exonuclease
MVCSACNGKGYVTGNDGERACPDCQGRGELLTVAPPPAENERAFSNRSLQLRSGWSLSGRTPFSPF